MQLVPTWRQPNRTPCPLTSYISDATLAITSPAEGMTMIEEVMRAAPEELAGILSRYHSHLAR